MLHTDREPQLRALLAEIAGHQVEPIDRDADLVEALNLDSLGGLRLLAKIEQHFEVRFPDACLTRLRTITAVLEAIDTAGEKS